MTSFETMIDHQIDRTASLRTSAARTRLIAGTSEGSMSPCQAA